MIVSGPDSVGALEPFDLRVFWNDDMIAGDLWYGAITIGTDAYNPGNIGAIPVDLMRVEDDVNKSAERRRSRRRGRVLVHHVRAAQRHARGSVLHAITDAIPAGFTYVEDSAQAMTGDVSVADGIVTWTGAMQRP